MKRWNLMRQCLFVFYALFICVGIFPQQMQVRILDNSPADEKKQKKRQEWFYKVKHDSSVVNIETARWRAFENTKTELLKSQRLTLVADWQTCGPSHQAGRMLTLAFDPINSSTIYAGSSTGGLWKTTNSGNSWLPLTDNLPSLGIGAVSINPQDNNMLLIGTGEGFLLSTWFQYGIGVLKSTDAGLTWNPTSLAVADSLQFASLDLEWDPVNPANVYLATTDGIYVSQDYGDNWTLELPGVGTSIEINKQSPNMVYASLQDYQTSAGGIHKSTDYGQTWQMLGSNLPPSDSIGFTTLSMCDSFPNTIYAGISESATSSESGQLQGLYKTTDGGNTWNLLPFSVDFYCYPTPSDVCQGWYANVTKVSPIDTNTVWAGGIFLYKSTDGGISWNYGDDAPLEDPPWMHPDHHYLAIDPMNTNIMYSLHDGGIFRSTNAGTSWTNKNDGLMTTQFYYTSSAPSDPNRVIGGTQDNGLWYNNNFNTSTVYNQFERGDGFACEFDPTDPSIIYATELYSGRMKSTNGGLSYNLINTGLTEATTFVTPLVLDPINNQVLYTATDYRIYKSTNAGTNWNPVYTAPYITIFEIDPVNPDIIYGCIDPAVSVSYIYRSTNAGASWIQIANPGNKVTDIEADPLTSGTLYASRSKHSPYQQLFKSVDFGNTWTTIADNFPQIPVNTIAISSHNHDHIYVGTDLGVYLSIDGGSTWDSYNDNLPNVIVQDMHYYAPDSTLRCGTHGRGIWKTKAADPTIISVEEVDLPTNMDISIYPNPSIDHTTISYTVNHPGIVNIKVLNQLGQEVNQLANSKHGEGSYLIDWNCRNANGQKLANGIYYIRFIQQNRAFSIKILIGS